MHKNKSVLITGASRGIGKAAALSFARAGASIIGITARSIGDLDAVETDMLGIAKEAGLPAPKVVKIALDVTSTESVSELPGIIHSEFNGKLDILISNAGVLESCASITESNPDVWWKTWEVNVKGTYLVTKAMLPIMLKGGEGIVVFMSSIGAHQVSFGWSSYQASPFLFV